MERMKKERTMGSVIIDIILKLFIVIITPVVVGTAGWFYHGTEAIIARDVVLSVIGAGCVLFLVEQEKIAVTALFENEKEFRHFVLILLFGLACAVFFPLLPVTGWPYPVLAVFIALFSSSIIGIVANAFFLCISVSLAGAGYSVFLLYFISGCIAILLFRKLDEEFKITIPIFVSGMVLVLMSVAEVIFFSTEKITAELFIIPCINIFITSIFYLIFLKYFSYKVVHRYRDKYMKLTDPEYPLLVELKGKSKESYYHAVHCAYLCDKIAGALGCNKTFVKAGGYYHKLSLYCNSTKTADYEVLMEEHAFPPNLCGLLMEYNGKELIQKENAIIYFADSIVTSILFILKKDSVREIDYNQVIMTVFDKKIASGLLDKNNITMAELCRMKQIFVEEKLYYDFLR